MKACFNPTATMLGSTNSVAALIQTSFLSLASAPVLTRLTL